MAISIGTLIANRYEVVKTLAGGMGLVYLCLDRAEEQYAQMAQQLISQLRGPRR